MDGTASWPNWALFCRCTFMDTFGVFYSMLCVGYFFLLSIFGQVQIFDRKNIYPITVVMDFLK